MDRYPDDAKAMSGEVPPQRPALRERTMFISAVLVVVLLEMLLLVFVGR